jgi:ketopantoate reductase
VQPFEGTLSSFLLEDKYRHNTVTDEQTVFKTPAEAAVHHYDYVVCAHKAIDQDAVFVALKPVVDETTTVVIIQNGVGNEPPFREAFPDSSIITCVVRTSPTLEE